MTMPDKLDSTSLFTDAIRAKRERKSLIAEDIAFLETSLLADIEAFDLDAAEREARREQSTGGGAGMVDCGLIFPEIVPISAPRYRPPSQPVVESKQPELKLDGGSLLNQLRQQAESRQRELHIEQAGRCSANSLIDQALKYLFSYLHDFVQQLNVVKPAISRDFPLLDQLAISQLVWQEGFADYRTQSASGGGLVELVTFTCRLKGDNLPAVGREGPSVERFRRTLFDYGLQFNCNEFKSRQGYVERAEFEIRSEISVSARWRADYAKGVVMLEARNLERLGSTVFTIYPRCVDDALLDEFGRLILGQANRFRELANRR